MTTSEVLVDKDSAVLTVTFNRPTRHNAMTWEMYDALIQACEQADRDGEIRVMILRGAGDKAFVAGTDIGQFVAFETGADGVAYERRIAGVLDRLEAVTVPTLAAVRGFCVGAGLAIAAVCDLRIAARSARFGVPIARTVGNCLSINTCSVLVSQLGPARTLDLLLRARLITAEAAFIAGFVSELCDDSDLEQVTAGVVQELVLHAPLSMWAAKESVRRLRRSLLPDGDDIVARVFDSDDFHRAVRAFESKEVVQWTGR